MKSVVLIVAVSIAALTGCARRDSAESTPDTASSPPEATPEPAPFEPAPAAPAAEESLPTPPEASGTASPDTAPVPAGEPGPEESAADCNAEPVQRLVGEVYTPELGEEARVTAGARVARALRPGQIVTMEFRADRLSFTLDEKGRISSVNCG